MKIQIEVQEVLEDISSHAADRRLRDRGEDGVAQFLEEGGADPSSSIYNEVSLNTSSGCWGKGDSHASTIVPTTVVTLPPKAAKSTFIVSTMDLK